MGCPSISRYIDDNLFGSLRKKIRPNLNLNHSDMYQPYLNKNS